MDKITVKYPSSIENFRALMDEFMTSNNFRWTSTLNETIALYNDWDFSKKDEKKDGWNVVLLEPVKIDVEDKGKIIWGKRRGVIHAFERLQDITSVNFYDGQEFDRILNFQEREKIGKSFGELIELIESIWKQTKEEKSKSPKDSRIEKRGQSRYSITDRLKALYDWDKLDKGQATLRQFLDSKFDEYVDEQTFHSWRRRLRKSGDYKD